MCIQFIKNKFPRVTKESEFLKDHTSSLPLWKNIQFSVQLLPFRKIGTMHNSSLRKYLLVLEVIQKELEASVG